MTKSRPAVFSESPDKVIEEVTTPAVCPHCGTCPFFRFLKDRKDIKG